MQVSWLGYPAATGLSAIDYRVTDAVCDPPDEPGRHGEAFVRLPGPFCCYAAPLHVPQGADPPPAAGGAAVFGSLHKLEKLNERVTDLWARILREVPESRLLLCRNTLQGATADYWREQFTRRGLPAGRLELRHVAPVGLQHLRVYDGIDVALDAFPWSGHTTACEALWMGVPVVTLRGRLCAGRMVASVLEAVGLPELIAETPEDYGRIAADLAHDGARRKELRETLRVRMLRSPLCDKAGFTRGLEEAYRTVWRAWCRGGGTPLEEPLMTLKYLLGPVPAGWAERYWGGPRRRGECVAFADSGDADLRVAVGDSWGDVLARLPAGWRPDAVVLYLAYASIPPGLWSAPVPLVGLAADWNLLWHGYRMVLPCCERVLTDAPGVEVMRRQGFGHGRAAVLYGPEPAYIGLPLDGPPRDLDVLFVGNLSPAVQRERLPWLGRLARLAGRRARGDPLRRLRRRLPRPAAAGAGRLQPQRPGRVQPAGLRGRLLRRPALPGARQRRDGRLLPRPARMCLLRRGRPGGRCWSIT